MSNALNLHPSSEGKEFRYKVKGTFLNKDLLSGPNLSGKEYKRFPLDDGSVYAGKSAKEVKDWINKTHDDPRITSIKRMKS